MIVTRERLEQLSEAEFRDSLVIPLFRAMGYRDVRSHHGGILEQGKDVVMHKVDDFGTRRNVAVVVKAEKISGSASTLANTALTQIQQALGSTFLDDVTRERLPVHEVLLVNSHPISEQALESFRTSLIGARTEHLVGFVAGERLWELLQKHLPSSLIFGTLLEAQAALARADSQHGYTVHVGPQGAQFTISPISEDAPPLQVSFEPDFPSTEEGIKQREAFERFLRTGEEAEVDKAFLKVHGLPQSFEGLMTSPDSGRIVLGPSVPGARFVADFLLERPPAPPQVLLRHVELEKVRGGTDEFLLSNRQQSSPFQVSMTVRARDQAGTFSFEFGAAEGNAHTYSQAVEIQSALSRGGMLYYEDVATGFRYRMFELAPGEIEDPGDAYVELWGRVAEIQRLARIVIPFPNRPHFLPADISKIAAVLAILKDGIGKGNRIEISVGLTARAVAELLSNHADGLLGELLVEQPTSSERVLDTTIPLGPVKMKWKDARISPATLSKLEQECARAVEAPDKVLQVQIEPGDSGVVSVQFLDWLGPTQRTES